jgi:hypothetical protein
MKEGIQVETNYNAQIEARIYLKSTHKLVYISLHEKRKPLHNSSSINSMNILLFENKSLISLQLTEEVEFSVIQS